MRRFGGGLAWGGLGGAAATGRGQRVLYGFVLVGAIAFVVAGIVLIAIGATKGRPEYLLVGAVGILFFGACSWIALAVMRGKVQLPRG